MLTLSSILYLSTLKESSRGLTGFALIELGFCYNQTYPKDAHCGEGYRRLHANKRRLPIPSLPSVEPVHETTALLKIMSDHPHPDEIADCVLNTFNALPAKFKPRRLADGRGEWVPLAGIVLSRGDDRTSHQLLAVHADS